MRPSGAHIMAVVEGARTIVNEVRMRSMIVSAFAEARSCSTFGVSRACSGRWTAPTSGRFGFESSATKAVAKAAYVFLLIYGPRRLPAVPTPP